MPTIVPRDYVTVVDINGKEFVFSPANFYLANASLMTPKELKEAVIERFEAEKLLHWDKNKFENPLDLIERIKQGIKRKHGSFKFLMNDPFITYDVDGGIARADIITNKPKNRRDGERGTPGNHEVRISKKRHGLEIYSTSTDFSENLIKNHTFIDLKLSQLILKLLRDGYNFVYDLMPFKIENIKKGSTVDTLVKYYVENQTKFQISRELSQFSPIYVNEQNIKQKVIRQKLKNDDTDNYVSALGIYMEELGYKFQANVIEFKNSPHETIGEKFSNGTDSVTIANVKGIVVLVYREGKGSYVTNKEDQKFVDPKNQLIDHPLTLLNKRLITKDDYDKRFKNSEIYLPYSVPLGDLKEKYIQLASKLDCSPEIIKKIR